MEPISLMARLKNDTKEAHTRAERGRIARLMLTGDISRYDFAVWLRQLLEVHNALENSLLKILGRYPQYSTVICEDQFMCDSLVNDIKAFGYTVEMLPLGPHAEAFAERIQAMGEAAQLELLGSHYVFEGSKNGGKFIAAALSRAWGIESGTPGLSYLDPYGSKLMERWAQFKRSMDMLHFTAETQESIIQMALLTFGVIGAMQSDCMALTCDEQKVAS